MRKICFFVGFYPLLKGGAEYQSRLISDELKKDNDIFFISADRNIKDRIENYESYKVYHVGYNSILNKLLLYYPVSFKVKKIILKEKPDLIYQRVLNPFSYHLSRIAKKRCALFIHIADIYSLTFSKRSVISYIKKAMFKEIKKNNIIVQTREQEAMLRKLGTKSVLQIFNMHPIKEFDLKNSLINKINSSTITITWIGSSRAVKQLELFIDIAEGFIDNESVEFNIIGRIENSPYGKKILDMIKESRNIIYHGEQDNSYVNNFIEKSYLVVNTSSSEGFSNVFIQSWILGVPILSLNSNPDGLFDDYRLGFYCENNLDLLKQKLVELVENKQEYSEIAQICYNVSRKLFSIKKSINILKKTLKVS